MAGCAECAKLWNVAEKRLFQVVIAWNALRAIADDGALECRCGYGPYTDGALCPRCQADRIADMLFARLPAKVKRKLAPQGKR